MSKMRFFNTERKVKRLKPLTTSGKELKSSHNRRFSIFSRFFLDFFSISSQTPQLLRASARTTQDSRLKTHSSRLTTQDSFTLVEMLVVIGIILVLAGLVMGVGRTLRRQARETNTKALIRKIEIAMESYKNQYGHWPDVIDFNEGGTNYEKLAEYLLENEVVEPARIESDCVVDFWNNYIRVIKEGYNHPGLDIWSPGPNGVNERTSDPDDYGDDIVNWTRGGSW
jgi:type II secretory pathway pseudopilin PulG